MKYFFAIAALTGAIFAQKNKEVTIFSARHYDVDAQVYALFEQKTGIKVNVVKGNADELIYRLEREKKLASADLFVTADAGKLILARNKGLFQSINSKKIHTQVPEHLRDKKEDSWTALTKRARVLVFLKNNVDATVKNYEDLARPELRGKVLSRSSDNGYNRDLTAALIAHWGEDKTLDWMKGFVANFAREPKGHDRDQMKALAAGEGVVALTNSYYVGKLIHSNNPEEAKVGEQMQVVFPNQDGFGTHINISGAGLLRQAKNKANAIALLEFLTSEEAQAVWMNNNHEFPVNVNLALSPTLQAWGTFKEDNLDFENILLYQSTANKLFEAAGWK